MPVKESVGLGKAAAVNITNQETLSPQPFQILILCHLNPFSRSIRNQSQHAVSCVHWKAGFGFMLSREKSSSRPYQRAQTISSSFLFLVICARWKTRWRLTNSNTKDEKGTMKAFLVETTETGTDITRNAFLCSFLSYGKCFSILFYQQLGKKRRS